MRPDDIDWAVYVILDPAQLPSEASLYETARAALAGGAGLLQLRDKQSSDRQLFERAGRLQSLCRDAGAIFVVNDRPDVALAVGADGVHLGPDDLPIGAVRDVAPELVIGGSAGEPERAVELERAGADYLGCGAVYDASPSKSDASAPRGPEGVARVVSAVSLPVVGIGGIQPDNAEAVVRAGADGVAVIRAVCGAEAPREAVERLRAAADVEH